MEIKTVRNLPLEERSEIRAPDAFYVSQWEAYLPHWVTGLYYLVCKASVLNLDKNDQDVLIERGRLSDGNSNFIFRRRSLQRFVRYFPPDAIPMDRDAGLSLLESINLIVQYDGLWDVCLNPPFPEDVLELDLWQRNQLFVLRYHQIYASRLNKLRSETGTSRKIFFHRDDMGVILGSHRRNLLDQILKKAMSESLIDIETLDVEKIVVVFRPPVLTVPNMSEIEERLINRIEDPLLETSIRDLDVRFLGRIGEERTRIGLSSLQQREMVVSDTPIEDAQGDEQFFMQLVTTD